MSIELSAIMPQITRVLASCYTAANRVSVKWIVLHCTEGREHDEAAEACASRFAWANPKDRPRASAHYAVDANSIVQCVPEKHVAWHAPGANRWGIGIEHCGRARQSRAEWLDVFGRPMLGLSALLVERIAFDWSIPLRMVDAEGLRAGVRGITTHAMVSEAWPEKHPGRAGHQDPGPGFPINDYLAALMTARARREQGAS